MGVHTKVTAGALTGAVVGLMLNELSRRGITLQPDEAADVTVLVSALVAWLVPSSNGDDAPPPPVAPPPQHPAAIAPPPAV